jgi:predicted TIM-barrel fold metal-dependent hydrolase
MRVLDSDGHVIEPSQMWQEYLEPKYHAEMPRPAKDENGRFCYAVGGTQVMRTASSLAVPFKNEKGEVTRREMPSGGWDPVARLRDMDAEDIDIAVLYPTLAFFFPELASSELHAALCRAYNDWLGDYVRSATDRLLGVALLPLEDEIAASVAEQVGDDVLVWSSDYPHPDSPFPGAVKKTLETLAELPPESQRKILAENGLRLYGIE